MRGRTHLDLADDTGTLPCWCSTVSDPFAVIRKGDVIEVELLIHDADVVTIEGDPMGTLTDAPAGRFVAINVRPTGME